MTDKIYQLTPEQEAIIPEYTKKYIDIGLSTKPVNFEKAKAAIQKFQDGEDEGYEYVFVESPIQIPAHSKFITWGAHDSFWVGFYKYFNDNFGICPLINEMDDIVENCSWVRYTEDDKKIWISNSPKAIKFDEENRTHCENGPAIEYRDGFAVYIWHGVRVNKDWIMNPDSVTIEDCLRHENVELRRVACEIKGWANVINSLDYRVIDEDGDPEIGTLLEVKIPEIGTEKFLRVMCGTKREFALPVDPSSKTALEAQASLFGLSVEEFQVPEIRT